MAQVKPKNKISARKPRKATASPPLDPLRAGMPALDSITGMDEFKSGKNVFRIIHTKEVDGYEKAPPTSKRRMP